MEIIIVGDGKVGFSLTQMLSAEEHDITVVDVNAKVLARTQEEYDTLAIVGHGASRAVLEEAGAATARLLIAATSSDEINLLSCLTARKMGCHHTIARVRNPEYAEDMSFLREEMGLSFAINPEEACAREIFHLLQFPSFLSREPFAQGRVEIVQIKACPGSPLIGIPLAELYSAARVKVLVCAIERDNEIIIPDGTFVIQENDELFITAKVDKLTTLLKNLELTSQKVTQVTLVGGSRLGFYLAERLLASGVGVKIIERDSQRCQQLAELLPDADIVEADGTEQEVLLSEGVPRSDALVALTGIDEENIVLSMYARQIGVKQIITKCNRSQYADLLRNMGIDKVVSPKMTSVEVIVRYVRAMENSTGGKMVTMHRIADGKAEALEFRADSSVRLLGKTLTELQLKKGILIASIFRGKDFLIPDGNTIIQEGDLVVVVAAAGRQIFELNDVLEEE